MGELQTIVSKCRPEQLLARIESSQPYLIAQLSFVLDARPDRKFMVYRQAHVMEESLAANRSMLSQLPSDEMIAELVSMARTALGRSTESFVRPQVADLLGSFPTANITDPETFISALIFDLLDAKVPDAIIYFAFQNIRRTSRFLPSIAEVFGACNHLVDKWRDVLEFPDRLVKARQLLEATVAECEQALSLALEEQRRHDEVKAALENRWPKLVPKAQKFCPYPSLIQAFEGNREVREILSELDFDSMGMASAVLATKGMAAAEAMIRKRAERCS